MLTLQFSLKAGAGKMSEVALLLQRVMAQQLDWEQACGAEHGDAQVLTVHKLGVTVT